MSIAYWYFKYTLLIIIADNTYAYKSHIECRTLLNSLLTEYILFYFSKTSEYFLQSNITVIKSTLWMFIDAVKVMCVFVNTVKYSKNHVYLATWPLLIRPNHVYILLWHKREYTFTVMVKHRGGGKNTDWLPF